MIPLWFIYWLFIIFVGSFIAWEMGNGNWILSAILIGFFYIAYIIYAITKEPKDILKKSIGAIIGFIIIFAYLAFISQEDPNFIEEQTEYIQNNQ